MYNIAKSREENGCNFIQDEDGVYDKKCKIVIR